MAVDLKAATQDTTVPSTAVVFGADSQSAASPSVYLATTFVSATVADLAQTWNAGATTFTGLKLNVTDTASAAGSLLADFQVGGTSKFKLSKTGIVTVVADTVTANAPMLDLAQTWNETNTTFSAVKLNVTNTASASASKLIDLQVGGSTQGYVRKDGVFYSTNNGAGFVIAAASVAEVGIGRNSAAGGLNLYGNGVTNGSSMRVHSNGATLPPAGYLGWGDSTVMSDPPDIQLRRDAAGVMAQRNGTNAQGSRLYNTYTDASNYERGKVEWSSNVLLVGTEKAGTGTARALDLQTDATTRVTVGAAGGLTFADANNIAVGSTTGTKLGTATTQKLGFWNSTPAVQPTAVADATNATDVITQLNALLSRLRTIGIIAT